MWRYQRNSLPQSMAWLVQAAAGHGRVARAGTASRVPSCRQKAGSVAAALAGIFRVAFKLLAQRRKAGPAERGHDHRRRKLWIGRDTKAEVPHRRFAGGQHDLGQRLATRLAVNEDLARAPLNDGAAERGGSELRLAKATEQRFQLRQPHRLRLSSEGGNHAPKEAHANLLGRADERPRFEACVGAAVQIETSSVCSR